jgi:plastocyanin
VDDERTSAEGTLTMAMHGSRYPAAAVGLIVAGLALTGCGSSGSTTASSAKATASNSPPSASASSTPSTAASSPASNSAPVTVTATETDFAIALSQTAFKAGAYTFTVVNQGHAPHDLAIKGPGIDSQVKSQTVQNGGTTPLSVTLQPGSYELWCTVGNHRQMGMDMTIQVS